MKKNGWGLRTELLFILMFLMCLVIATIGLNKMGLLGGNSDSIDEFKTDVNSEETYESMEERLNNAAKDYVVKYYGGENISDSIVVRYSSLYYNSYIAKLVDNKGRSCSGYVEVENINSNLIYYSYLKCPEYKTSGYDSSKDW